MPKYCETCGNRYVDEAPACPFCHPPADQPSDSLVAEPGTATLRLRGGKGPSAAFAGFGARFGAYWLDYTANGLIAIAGALVLALILTAVVGDFADAFAIAVYAAGIPLSLAYPVVANAVGGGLGKRALGLRVVDAQGRSPGLARGVTRTVVSWLSYAVIIGCLAILWDDRRRAWHDHAAGTFVVHARA